MNAKEAYLAKPWVTHYPEGVPETVTVPHMSVPQAFDKMADQYAKKNALIFYGKKITYGKLKELTDSFAAALSALGVSKGDTVAMYLLNCPQYVIAYFGALKVGAKSPPSVRSIPVRKSSTSLRTVRPGPLSVKRSSMTTWNEPG